MDNWMQVEIYPEEDSYIDDLEQLIEDTMMEEGVRGSVSVNFIVPDKLQAFGIRILPAIVINDKVVMEGKLPNKNDIVKWFNMKIPNINRMPKVNSKNILPLTIIEAANQIINLTGEMGIKNIREIVDIEDYIINANVNWGQYIRNKFGLWSGNLALLKDCGTNNPDEASRVIIEKAVRKIIENEI